MSSPCLQHQHRRFILPSTSTTSSSSLAVAESLHCGLPGLHSIPYSKVSSTNLSVVSSQPDRSHSVAHKHPSVLDNGAYTGLLSPVSPDLIHCQGKKNSLICTQIPSYIAAGQQLMRPKPREPLFGFIWICELCEIKLFIDKPSLLAWIVAGYTVSRRDGAWLIPMCPPFSCSLTPFLANST